jgi:UDP-2-acetamido-2-deoxy-ribo-hexuluronate aminotransferase
MDTLQCAVLLAKLERFDWEIARRGEIGRRYNELLRSVPGVGLVQVRPDRTSVYAQYTVRCADRDGLQKRLKEKGIPSAVHYPLPLHQQPAYAPLVPSERFPVAERLAQEVISLPMHPELDEDDQARIAEAVAGALKGVPRAAA